jgi:malate dehydrogenase (oxaloacetate-decarboxylating)
MGRVDEAVFKMVVAFPNVYIVAPSAVHPKGGMPMTIYDDSVALHAEKKGKLEIKSKVPLKDKRDLSLAYTPGVAEPCRRIHADKEQVYKLTIKQNSVAVVSDGSAVLGLGNIGPEAAIPVMEGKAILFKEFGNIDAFPICVASQDPAKIIETVKMIAPVFGGINLEDIKAPECFEVEEQLQGLGIPVMHDDQHGTAVVVLAAMINALKVVKKDISKVRVTLSGAGAAGTAVTKLLIEHGLKPENVILCDRSGPIYDGRPDLSGNKYKLHMSRLTNKNKVKGTLVDAIKGADIFIGVSSKNLLTPENIRTMAPKPIVFAMANPDPEILPDDARKGGAAVVATGRSDYPNQVNNVLGFPGIFRGALDVRATRITTKMKLAAAQALASLVPNPTAEQVLPSPLDRSVVPAVAEAVKKAWLEDKH